ncbi:MAG TPA: hypothetical protein VGM24_02025 [Puia sp.]
MPLNPEILAQRIAELTKAYQRQVDKAGHPEYDPALTELLKKDLTWLQDQQEQGEQVPKEK